MQRKQKSAVVLVFRLQISRWEVRIVESSDARMAQSDESAGSLGLTADYCVLMQRVFILWTNSGKIRTFLQSNFSPKQQSVRIGESVGQ